MVKSLFQGCNFAMVFLALNARRGRRAIWRGIAEAPVSIAVSALLQASVNVLIPLSLLETTSARALMFISVNPLWAAVMGRVLLNERMEWPTLVALAVALGAIALVFVPSLVDGGTAGEGQNDGSVRGDIISLLCGTCVAAFLTANRRASSLHPNALLSVAGVIGCFMPAYICLPPALALRLASHVHTPDGHHAGALHLSPGPDHAFADLEPLFWPVILVDSAMVVGCIITAMMIAPRYISATQVALLLLLRAPLPSPYGQSSALPLPAPTLPRHSLSQTRAAPRSVRARRAPEPARGSTNAPPHAPRVAHCSSASPRENGFAAPSGPSL
jgi:hypothetical protein